MWWSSKLYFHLLALALSTLINTLFGVNRYLFMCLEEKPFNGTLLSSKKEWLVLWLDAFELQNAEWVSEELTCLTSILFFAFKKENNYPWISVDERAGQTFKANKAETKWNVICCSHVHSCLPRIISSSLKGDNWLREEKLPLGCEMCFVEAIGKVSTAVVVGMGASHIISYLLQGRNLPPFTEK